MITDATAIVSTMYQVELCRKPTVVDDPQGAVVGISHATSDDALVMRNTPPNTRPRRPMLSSPVSSDRARMNMIAKPMIDRTATSRPIHAT